MNDVAFAIGNFDEETGYRPLHIPDRGHENVVYFILNGNRVKIGTTTHLRNRVRALALAPRNVIACVPGDRRKEDELHARFSELRIGRTEWFAFEDPIADAVNDWHARAIVLRRHANANLFAVPHGA
ncbi:GIY-YIG nuclease family protein [Streptomyces canus]|uniref:GIY-YIG nuclease family protein n=1 Tax=Streptomyces canus TaxID=58343 RepID=UPI0003A69134|nr:GIY-YIG nuclease family protein [Streptomyces canus]